MEMKISLWIICALIIILDDYLIIKDKKIKEEKSEREELYNRLYERQELFDRNLPRVLMDNLERNSLLTDFFHTGQNYEKKYNFNKAIKMYRECLNNSDVPEEEKITLNVLIGNCYYFLSKLNEAEKHFKESLNILKIAENKIARLPAKSIALGNIGNIYHNLGKPDEALEYYQQALGINKKLGYEHGIAHNLNNIGAVYNELGKYDEALRYQEEALGINKKIEDEQGIANSLTNIGVVYNDSGKPNEALNYYQEALEVFIHMNAQPRIEILLKIIKIIEEEKKEK